MNSNYKSFFEFACCWLKQKGEFTCRSIATLVVLFSLFATQSSANDIASHEFLGWQNLTDYSNETIAGNVQNSVLNFGTFNTCPKPSNGVATIDGRISDWDLDKDFFADMYRAGKPDKKVESKLYVKYDCKTEKLCVLVKTVRGVIALKQKDDAFIKILGKKVVDGNSGSTYFRWIYKNGMAVGFEACGKVAPGQYTDLNVHLQVMDMESQTSAVADRMIPICLDECACELEIECPKKWQGGDKPCDFVAPDFKTLRDFYALGGKIHAYCDDVKVISYTSEGGACAGWLKKMMTLSDGENEHTCVVQWDFKKDDLAIHCPRPVDITCKTQEEVDKKFRWWLREYKVEGACNGYRVVTRPENPQAPKACEGGYVKVKFIVIDGCGRRSYCESSFKVRKPAPVEAWAPRNLMVDYCLPQREVEKKFQRWLAGFGARGGCDLVYNIYVVEGDGQTRGEKPVAPSNCGGYVKVKIKAYDNVCLKMEAEDYAVFTVKEAPELKLIYPDNKWLDYCLSQEEVNKEFRAWLMKFSAEGGCATASSDLWGYDAPRACGGKVEVEFWAYDKCGQREGIKRIFGVKRAPKLEYKYPPDVTLKACSTQDEINRAFRRWLTGFMVTGGCSPIYPDVWKYKAPHACGGEVEIKFWITDRCSKEVGRNVTFTVEPAPELVVHCPADAKTRPCLSPERIKVLYLKWIKGFSVEGGCNPRYPTTEELLRKYPVPDACGDEVTVDFWVSDKCSEEQGCQKTFTVPYAPELKVQCARNMKVEACKTQDEVNKLFRAWLGEFKTDGGCEAKSEHKIDQRPQACGSKTQVIYYAKDACEQTAQCTAYFYVVEPTKLEVKCAPDMKVEACKTQDEVNKLFRAWLGEFKTDGGCFAKSEHKIDQRPQACGSKTQVIYYAKDACEQTAQCTAYFYVVKPTKLEVKCAPDMKVEACKTQDEVNKLFRAWLGEFKTDGGCYAKSEHKIDQRPQACGSKTQVIYYAKDACEQTAQCTAYFYVVEPTKLEVKCAPDMKVEACKTQDEVNKLFRAWLGEFKTDGGCFAKSEHKIDQRPQACGSKTQVIYYAKDACEQTAQCTAYFYVVEPTKLEVKCPPNYTVPACSTQDEVDMLFKRWLNVFRAEGGCYPEAKFSPYERPYACGSKTEVIFYAKDKCEQVAKCSAYFIVEKAPELTVTCPPNYTMPACSTQDEVDMLFKRWLNVFKVEGGCYPEAKFNQYEHPKACGSKTEVIFYAKDKCDQEAKCVAYFIVAKPDEIKAVCPPTGKAEACLTQPEVDELFKAWLQGFKAEGGCNAKGKFLPYVEPKACGDKVEVTYYVYDECKQEDKCTAYFYVAKPDELKAICPPSYTMPACATQDDIDQTFKRWINVFRTEGGCNPVSTNLDKYEAPKLCGGVVKIKFETKDICGMYDYCESYFKVDERKKVEVYCPANHTADANQTPAEVAAEWEAWLDKFTAKGPCEPLTVKYYLNGEEVASLAELKKLVPDACGSDDQTVKVVAYDDCSKDYCEAKFNVEETFERLILSVPDDQKLCHPGKYAPTKEDLPPPLTKEEVLVALTVPKCIQPVEPTFTIMVMGPEVSGNVYKFTRIYKVKAGSQSTESAEIIKLVWDKEGPVFKGIPGTQMIPCGSEPPGWPTVTAEDGHGRSIEITRKQEKSFILCGGTYWIRTWIAADECGNVARRTQKIYYQDETPPVLEIPADTTIYCPGQIPEPTYEAYDDCSRVKVEYKESRKDQNSCEYTITRTWTAYDGCGRKTVKSQVITVIDDEAPVITPVNPMLVDIPNGGEMITYNCDAPAVTMGDVEVYDECCSDFIVETKDELISNATCDVFGYYRRWKCSVTATDDAGNTSEYYFYVLQYDTTAPEILNVPEDLVLGCEDTIPAAATGVEVSDNCSLEKVPEYREEVFFDPQDANKYGIVRTWHSTDHCGNYGEDYQIIAKCGFDVSLIEAKLGNSVWLDENGNGLQETEEPGIDGVTVYLHQVRVVGGETKTSKIDSTVTTTIDGNAGQYEFDQLVRGTYQLQFSQPDGMEFTLPFAGVDATNSDVDPRTGFTEEIDLGFGQKRMEFDAGFLKGPLFDAAPLADFNFETNNQPVVEIDDISVFPNPTTALINVAMDIPEDGRVQLNIIDQLGQIVLSQTRNLNRGKQTETIDLHAIPAGTYLLNVKMSDRSITKMIIRN